MVSRDIKIGADRFSSPKRKKPYHSQQEHQIEMKEGKKRSQKGIESVAMKILTRSKKKRLKGAEKIKKNKKTPPKNQKPPPPREKTSNSMWCLKRD